MARGERPQPERTSEERERARAERERRRAEREGRPVPAEPVPLEVEPPIAPPEPAEPPTLPPEPVNAPPVIEAEADHAPIDPPEAVQEMPIVVPEEEPPAAEPVPAVEHVPVEEPAAVEEPAHVEEPAAVEEPAHVEEPPPPEPVAAEEPVPLEPVAAEPEPAEPEAEMPAEHLHAEEQPEHEEPAGDAEPASPHASRRDPDGHYPIPGLPEEPDRAPPDPLPEPPPRLPGPEPTPMRRAFRRSGSGAGGAGGAALASEGRSARSRVVHPRWVALAALLVIGVVVALLVASLSRSSSHDTSASTKPEVKVLIPEGKTRLQIAQIASKAGLTGSYRRAARSSPLLNPVHYGAPHGTPDLEGFLFPATYDMNKGAPASRLVEEQLAAFQENFAPEYAARAKALGLTSYELLIVASMIEREAQVPADRAKIAAVIYNRLKAGEPLGVDATIYYAIENAKNIPTYTKELTSSQLASSSPYNTRTHKGLPPTPIANPGIASIQAAAHPAHVSYLYYVNAADGCGEMTFASTEAKFNEDVARYEAAKRANGGHPPTCKHH